MDLEQLRNRLAEISNLLGDYSDKADLSQEDVDGINSLNTEFEEVTAKIDAKEKLQANLKRAQESKRQVPPAAGVQPQRITVTEKAKYGGFNSTGDFLMAVKEAGNTGKIHPNFQNVMYEKNGEDGGFLVPEEMSSAIEKKLKVEESLWAQARTFNISGNTFSLNLDESQPWNAGIQAYWTAEGAPITESKPNFTQATWRLHKVAALVKATDELLEDAVALESYIKEAAPEAIMYKINSAMLTGNGVGKPEGLLNSGFVVTVAKEVGQGADTIVAENVIKMYARMFPQARAGAKWFINAGAEEALLGLKNANGDYIYLSPGSMLNQSPNGTLLGRPVVPMMSSLPALGDAGDIVFANLSYYYGIQKVGGIKQATSIHLHFDREITSFRFSMRVDGKVPFKTPVTTEFGAYQMSAIVKLADRA